MKVRYLGLKPYAEVYEAMKSFTETRTPEIEDELWIVEHPSVYTQGQNGKPEHILNACNIPIVQVDRGGQVTYHGPGQVVIYTLINFKARNCGVRSLVRALENAIIATLKDYGIEGAGDVDAPGVYVDGKKIAALGLRIRKGSVYHGLSLNVDMDLTPFKGINPCGYSGLEVVQMADLLPHKIDILAVEAGLVDHLIFFLDEKQLSL
ncbi:lipoyl(octanoyl) transferase LipB [Ignatzschineria rhizosphaerae]|uniref:Octanoyltransferase n=1 Tax=Ignatzschineria rhizosphaerae TaxID=2923279 RepID=A0ABY3WWH8_9GAMM|nr:lipoyl(octanoyl) transferase LipB [Ignatzschineria rhizosphaerae]UNM94974.1 lipoyl(octanoyl) transferase LipB [Ignatzschineria rhizosphaerae]